MEKQIKSKEIRPSNKIQPIIKIQETVELRNKTKCKTD